MAPDLGPLQICPGQYQSCMIFFSLNLALRLKPNNNVRLYPPFCSLCPYIKQYKQQCRLCPTGTYVLREHPVRSQNMHLTNDQSVA